MNKEPLNFLCAEDDPAIASLNTILIKRAFPDYNVAVKVVNTGEDLIDELINGATAYHGVVSDNTMLKNLTGEDALAKTRDFNTYGIQRVPTIIYSGDMNGLQKRVEAQHDAKFLQKPAEINDFINCMHSRWSEYAPKPKTN